MRHSSLLFLLLALGVLHAQSAAPVPTDSTDTPPSSIASMTAPQTVDSTDAAATTTQDGVGIATTTPLTGVSGSVMLTGGTLAPSGIVSFYRIDPAPDPGLPSLVRHAPVHPDGSYTAALPPGTYRVCTQVWEVPGLNPCFWSEQAPTLTVSAQSAPLFFPITLTAGQFLHVRVNEASTPSTTASSHRRANSAAPPPLRLGITAPQGLLVPARLLDHDATGSTYQAIYPLGQSPKVLLQHHGRRVADAIGHALPQQDWSDLSSRFSSTQHAHANRLHPDLTLSSSPIP